MTLRAFWERYPDAESPLRLWCRTAKHAEWGSLEDVRRTYPHADGVRTAASGVLTVFNIGGNKYRLIVRIRYDYQLINIREVLTHSEYDRGDWKGESMPMTKGRDNAKLPGRFEDLVTMMPPSAIMDDAQLESFIETIDELMASGRLTKGQALYMETLVQLVEAYEAVHYAVDDDLGGLEALAHLLEVNGMNASDLARLLGVHVSMGSKILNGDRSLRIDHLRKLAAHFNVSPALFLD